MSHRDEIELAQGIEEAEIGTLRAIAASPEAVASLSELWAGLESGTIALDELLRVPPAQHDAEAIQAQIQAVVDSMQQIHDRSKRNTQADRSSKDTARREFAATFLRYRLSPLAIARVLERLRALRPTVPSARARTLQKTEALVVENQQKGEQSRARLVEANLRLVYWMAGKRLHHGLPRPDLIQEGCLGLLRAVEKYDYRRGFRFQTYASWWIRAFMHRALSDDSRLIRLPVHMVALRSKLQKATDRHIQQRGQPPTAAELARATGVALATVEAALEAPKPPLSLETPRGPDGDERLSDRLNDDRQVSPAEALTSRDTRRRIRELLATLSPREQHVLRLHFGMDGGEAITLEEIGRRYSLSRERIRQIEGAALEKLRKHAEDSDLDYGATS